jgi:hypothetical protein
MNGLPPIGLPHVMVNGQLSIENGVANTDVLAGQPIRYPVIIEGEIDLDLNDKQYQWHADLPGYPTVREVYPVALPTEE